MKRYQNAAPDGLFKASAGLGMRR